MTSGLCPQTIPEPGEAEDVDFLLQLSILPEQVMQYCVMSIQVCPRGLKVQGLD